MSLFANCLSHFTGSKIKQEVKGFKVTDVKRTRKIGIACCNLKELKKKACEKLNIENDLSEINIYLIDGSLVDEEYFKTLDAQTTLILQKPGEALLTDADLLYETLRRVNIDYLTAGNQATKFITENLKRKVAVLHNLLNLDDSKTGYSHRDDHPEWFSGLETNITTKEAYMHRRCQDRIRGYLYKTIEQIKTSTIWLNNKQARLNLQNIIEFFKLQLKKDHYFGYYFDRSKCHKDEIDNVTRTVDHCYDHCPCKLIIIDGKNDDGDDDDANEKYVDAEKKIDSDNIDSVDGKRQSKINDILPAKKQEVDETIVCPYNVYSRCQNEEYSLCDSNGEFHCEGVWNYDNCKYGDRHKINPYRSKEELVLFSTWNLDHKLERSRTLVPQLLKYSEDNLINEKIVFKFYDNLFTIKNLRLVHIVCHDKGSHK